jgi:hypothetical protein
MQRSLARVSNEICSDQPEASASLFDTLSVAAFPLEHVSVGGDTFTVMGVGFAQYDPGRWRGPEDLPTIPASVSVSHEKIVCRFAVPGRLPLGRRRILLVIPEWSPPLFHFFATYTGRRLAVGGADLPVYRIVPADSIPRDFPCRRYPGAEVEAIPPTLRPVWRPPLRILRKRYDLGRPYASVPATLSLEVDYAETQDWVLDSSRGNQYRDYALDPEDVERVLPWLRSRQRAYRFLERARKYWRGDRSPFFVAIDRWGLVRDKQLDAALRNLEKATRIDPAWEEPRRLAQLVRLERQIAQRAGAEGPSRVFDSRLGVSFAVTSRLGRVPKIEEIEKLGLGAGLATGLLYQVRDRLTVGAEGIANLDQLVFFGWPHGLTFRGYRLLLRWQSPLRIQAGIGWLAELSGSMEGWVVRWERRDATYAARSRSYTLELGIVTRSGFDFSSWDHLLRLGVGYRFHDRHVLKDPQGDVLRLDGEPVYFDPASLFFVLTMTFHL